MATVDQSEAAVSVSSHESFIFFGGGGGEAWLKKFQKKAKNMKNIEREIEMNGNRNRFHSFIRSFIHSFIHQSSFIRESGKGEQ